MSNPILVGIDVHRKTNTVCAMDSQGQELTERFTVAHSIEFSGNYVAITNLVDFHVRFCYLQYIYEDLYHYIGDSICKASRNERIGQ